MEIPYTVSARPDTGLWNAKIGIWLFLASEVMLFGGLFSGYVFLRLGVTDGVDNPWPERQLIVWPGFVNTIILIASSVFVVMAWAELKMRNYARYQKWMSAVILCALLFLCLKAYEYYGKFTHHGIKLTDGSVIEGVLIDDKVYFEVDSVTLNVKHSHLNFLSALEEGEPKFKTAAGDEITLTREWLSNTASEMRRAHQTKLKELVESGELKPSAPLPAFDPTVKLTALSSLKFAFKPSSLRTYDAEGAVHRDNQRVHGKLVNDRILFEAHDVDLRMVEDPANAIAWKYLGTGAKEEFFRYKAEIEQEAEESGWKARDDERLMMHLHARAQHADDHGKKEKTHADAAAISVSPPAETGGAEEPAHGPGAGHGGDAADHGKDAAAHAGGGGHGYPELAIDRANTKRLASHGPSYSTYYAIYFTMTGLHGLHVLAGACVLAYFLFFNKKLYQQNPEHLANRVEVGGLFWHFVDLVWIFLFPIMYLM